MEYVHQQLLDHLGDYDVRVGLDAFSGEGIDAIVNGLQGVCILHGVMWPDEIPPTAMRVLDDPQREALNAMCDNLLPGMLVNLYTARLLQMHAVAADLPEAEQLAPWITLMEIVAGWLAYVRVAPTRSHEDATHNRQQQWVAPLVEEFLHDPFYDRWLALHGRRPLVDLIRHQLPEVDPSDDLAEGADRVRFDLVEASYKLARVLQVATANALHVHGQAERMLDDPEAWEDLIPVEGAHWPLAGAERERALRVLLDVVDVDALYHHFIPAGAPMLYHAHLASWVAGHHDDVPSARRPFPAAKTLGIALGFYASLHYERDHLDITRWIAFPLLARESVHDEALDRFCVDATGSGWPSLLATGLDEAEAASEADED